MLKTIGVKKERNAQKSKNKKHHHKVLNTTASGSKNICMGISNDVPIFVTYSLYMFLHQIVMQCQ